MSYHMFFLVNFFFISFIFSQSLPVNTTLADFFLPGSQPNESGDFDGTGPLDLPSDCSCHTTNNVETFADKWKSSMMSQAVVDPLYLASLTVANQDASFSGDYCLRCHTPTGWLMGRSIPTDGSALELSGGKDETSVNCMFCHRLVTPSPVGVNPYPEDATYTSDTYPIDTTFLATIDGHIPDSIGNGMFIVEDINDNRRGPFSGLGGGGHDKIYSPFHKRAELCGTCHDVSNPAFSNDGDNTYTLNALGDTVPSFNPYDMFPVERTYSEWLNSSFNTPVGISGTPFGGTLTSVSTCQDCHMPQTSEPITGGGDVDVRKHYMIGANTFVPTLLELSGDMTTAERDTSIARATWILQNAATLDVTPYGTQITVRVTNQTGHKLPSGYPEGRRIWLNVQAFNALGDTIYESGAYNNSTGILTEDSDIKIYQIKPGISSAVASATGLTSGPSFHFVLNDTIYSDNRIPPQGFSNSNFEAIQSPPIGYSYPDDEYWDETVYNAPQVPDSISVTLYYQTASKEYVEFLRDTNSTDSRGQDMYDLWNNNGKSAPVAMAQQSFGSGDIPLSVSLSGFTVKIINGFPNLTWQTHSETDNLGFIIYRKAENEHMYKEIESYKTNTELKGLGTSAHGTKYSYADTDTNLTVGRAYYYKIGDMDYTGEISYYGPQSILFDPQNLLRKSFELSGNYPNPFNNQTAIKFYIGEKQPVQIRVYDIHGKLVMDFPKYFYYAGENEVMWDGKNYFGSYVASGMYLYSVATRKEIKYGKMILLK